MDYNWLLCEYDVISAPNKFNLLIPCGTDTVTIQYEQTSKLLSLLHYFHILHSNLYNYCCFTFLFVKTTLLKYRFCTCHICLDVTCTHHRDIRNRDVYVFMIFVPHFTFPIAMAHYCHQIQNHNQFFTQLPTCCFTPLKNVSICQGC